MVNPKCMYRRTELSFQLSAIRPKSGAGTWRLRIVSVRQLALHGFDRDVFGGVDALHAEFEFLRIG